MALSLAAAALLGGCVIYEPTPLPPPPPPPGAYGPIYPIGYFVRTLPPGYRIEYYGRPYYVYGPNYFLPYRGGYRVVPRPYYRRY